MHWKRKLMKEIAELEKLDQTSTVRSKLARLRKRAISNHKGVNQQTKKTHCPQGHRYTKGNTYFLESGARRCKTCHRKASMKAYWKAQKKLKSKAVAQ